MFDEVFAPLWRLFFSTVPRRRPNHSRSISCERLGPRSLRGISSTGPVGDQGTPCGHHSTLDRERRQLRLPASAGGAHPVCVGFLGCDGPRPNLRRRTGRPGRRPYPESQPSPPYRPRFPVGGAFPVRRPTITIPLWISTSLPCRAASLTTWMDTGIGDC